MDTSQLTDNTEEEWLSCQIDVNKLVQPNLSETCFSLENTETNVIDAKNILHTTMCEPWVVTLSLCRCCLSEGVFDCVPTASREVNTPSQMLNDTFNIQLLPVDVTESALSALCALCRARLRDAHEFATQVRACELRFRELYQHGRIKVPNIDVEVKEESLDTGDRIYDSDLDTAVQEECLESKNVKKVRRKKKADTKNKKKCKPKKPKKLTMKKKIRQGRIGDETDDLFTQSGDTYKCKQCDKTCTSIYYIRYHIKNMHTDHRPHRCTECPTSFKTQTQLTVHKLDDHQLDERFKCNACDKSFNCKPERNRHINLYHMMGERIKCVACDKVFFRKQHHKTHMLRHHKHLIQVKKESANNDGGIEEKPVKRVTGRDKYKDYYTQIGNAFHCSQCDKTFTTSDNIKCHIRHVHKPKKCSHCPKSFKTQTQLLTHKLDEHQVDERFKCNACEKYFNLKQELQRHLNRYHMMGEQMKCAECDFECYDKLALKKHQIKHKTSKDFHCKYCMKSFLRKATLRLHERIHTGDKRAACAHCGRTFVQKSNLKNHMAKLHPELRF